jgi:3',5'-cyclic AMP phosphodiesterase CpdA
VKLLAVSDLHVRHPANRAFVENLPAHPDDWLILGGDLCERAADLTFVLDTLGPKFRRLIWVPGNHELWTMREDPLRGVAKYDHFVSLCRERGVLTPEDPYPTWPGDEGDDGEQPLVIAPLFLLYDYSFRPDDVPREKALDWALERDILCADEAVLYPDPFPTRDAWCADRCARTEARLQALDPAVGTVLINHFPLLQHHARLPRIPRFSLWCGTRRTHDWHTRFRARRVVYGHLHIRRTHEDDGVRFDEVSLGYPGQWSGDPARYLRTILP